jgi:hypothetical protein
MQTNFAELAAEIINGKYSKILSILHQLNENRTNITIFNHQFN